MEGKKDYISIRVILDDILDHPLLLDLSLERAVNYTLSFIRIVGIPTTFTEKTAEIEVKLYRALLPCDLYLIIQVRSNKGIFRASTDSFHMSPNKTKFPELTYKVLGGCIFTSIESGTIEIAYKAIAVDSDGFPLVANNSIFIRALESYIKYKCFTVLFDLGKITPLVYQNVQQEYAFNVGQAQSSMLMPSLDEMQSFSNSWNTLIARAAEHSKAFVTNGSMERLKLL